MPQRSFVPIEQSVETVKLFIAHFLHDQFPRFSHPLWKEFSCAVNNKWTPHVCFNNVKQNRQNIFGRALSELGVSVAYSYPGKNETIVKPNDSTEHSSIESDESTETISEVEDAPEMSDMEVFIIVLTSEEWDEIKPEDSSTEGNRHSLRKNVWTNIIASAIWKQTKMPCAYVFKRAKISPTSCDGVNYLTIQGQCKLKTCQNPVKAILETIPDNGEKVVLKMYTRNTRNRPHDPVKRPFNGKRRQQMQKELVNEGAANFRKRMAREDMELGDKEPPYLPNSAVLRQAKKEFVDNELGIDPLNKRDLIRAIEKISIRPEFAGVVKSIGSRPFHVFYNTPSQLHAYKEYCKNNRNKSSIIIDATGSIVKKFTFVNEEKSGHIFLYAIVINFEQVTIPVHQMLSEKHDAEFIEYWIRTWLRSGAIKPTKAISDYSKALLLAMSLAFNNVTLKSYVETCFLCIRKSEPIEFRTHIRVDVAHLIHLVSRWKCFKSIAHIEVKQFYLRCVALMVETSTMKSFQSIFIFTCAVAGQKYSDSTVNIPEKRNVRSIRIELEKLIGRYTNVDEAISSPENDDLRPGDEDRDNCAVFEDESGTEKEREIEKWIDELIGIATRTDEDGHEMNAFYVPSLISSLRRIAIEFPIWCNVTTPECGTLHATSSFIEAYFNDIKNRVLKGLSHRVDTFMVMHIRDIIGGSLLFTANTIKYNENKKLRAVEPTSTIENAPDNNCHLPSYCEIDSKFPIDQGNDSDLWSTENWKGKALKHDFNNDTIYDDKLEMDDAIHDEELTATDSNRLDHSYSKIVPIDMQADEISKNQKRQQEQRKPAVKRSKYFESFPEIKYVNTKIDQKPTTRSKIKSYFMPNGSLSFQPCKINNKHYFVRSTCAFDSFVHILLYGAVDNPNYASTIQCSGNETLTFICQTLNTGITKNTFFNRTRLLLNWYPAQPDVQTSETKIVSYMVNAWDSISNLVNKAMHSEPSLHVVEHCANSCSREYSLVLLSPNYNIIRAHGFGMLAEALDFCSSNSKLPCRENNCPGERCRTSRMGPHLLIDADVRADISARSGMRCRLVEIPALLKFRNVNDDHSYYRLIGVVAYTPGHFTAYCLRISGKWQLYDDTRREIEIKSADTEVEPHLFVYILSEVLT